jgi:hypothetical protein
MPLKHTNDDRVKIQKQVAVVRNRIKTIPVRSKSASKIKIKTKSVPQPPRQRIKVARSTPATIISKQRKVAKFIKTSRAVPNTKARMAGGRNVRGQNSLRVTRNVRGKKRVDRRVTTERIDEIRKAGVGRVLIIIGNGPSHKEAKLDLLKNIEPIDMMCINRPDDRVWPTTYWLFCDNSQLRRHKTLWTGYNGTTINSTAIKDSKPKTVRILTMHGKGFSNNMHNGMYVGRSSVYAAIQVGLWMAYDAIYVFGCDMTAVGGKLYPWGSNPDVSDKNRIRRFETEATFYNWAADHVTASTREKVIFCSSYNKFRFVDKFGRMDHKKAVKEILAKHAIPTPKSKISGKEK